MACLALLRHAPGAGFAARPSGVLRPGSAPFLFSIRLDAARKQRSNSSRAPLRCSAHGGHSDGHHSHDQHHSADDVHCCERDHDHSEPDPSNPVHRLLKTVYDATRLSTAASWLESSLPATVGKMLLFLLAAGASGWAASGWATSAAAAQTARSISAAATAGVFLLAGVPAAVDLSYDLTAGRVDTHVLMNLAVLGTLVTGHALEGALLLVLFQTTHVVEHMLTDRAQGNLAALYDAMPKEAVVVGVAADGSPDLSSAHRVRAADVAVGDCMLVKPGEQVPLDGSIIHGRAMVSSEHITGESLPVLRRTGDEVAAGSLNRDGVLVVRALRLVEESTPARIAKLTLDAQAKRPQLRTWLDEFGELYSKGVVAASVGLLAVLLLMGVPLLGAAGQRGAFYRTMGLLTVASPCALVMVPLAYVSAIAAIASRGILVKGGRVLDALAGCNTVAFDKTGTLTTGSLSCTSMRPLGASGSGSSKPGSSTASLLGLSPREASAAKRVALGAAVALSLRSNHPVSDAVVLHGQQAGLDGSYEDVSDFELVPGGGVQGIVTSTSGGSGGSSTRQGQQQQYHASFGSLEFVSGKLAAEEQAAVEKLAAGQSTSGVLSVLVLEPATQAAAASSGSNGCSSAARSVWVMSFDDSVRKQSEAAVRELQTGSWTGRVSQASRMAVTMLTGDNEASAQRIARKLGIRSVQAALSPEEKLAHVEQMSGRATSDESNAGGNSTSKPAAATRKGTSRRGSSKKRRRGTQGVIMVGDGINDAPALAAADVGVAIASTATAAASLAADVIVVNAGGIAAVPLLLKIARATQTVIRQNLALAVGSIVALSLPTVLGWVPLWLAVMLHEGSTLLVALNSLRLLAFGSGARRGSSSSWQPIGHHDHHHLRHSDDAKEMPHAAANGGRQDVAGGWEDGLTEAVLPVSAVPPAA